MNADGTWGFGDASSHDPIVPFAPVDPFADRSAPSAEQASTADNRIDALTGVAGRAEVLRQLAHVGDGGLGVVVLGLDNFRLVNDAYGHDFGDTVLRTVAKRLVLVAGPGRLVGRFGSDEFVVAVAATSSLNVLVHLADELHAAVKAPIELGNMTITVTASLGVAVRTTNDEPPARLLQDAVSELATAKLRGGDRAVLFAVALRATVERRMVVERFLRRAIDNGGLRAVLQPIVDAQNFTIIGAEALVRLEDPEVGMLPPIEFIPLAEELGLAPRIDEWMLGEAAYWAGRWHRRFPGRAPYVSCNVSGPLMQRGDLADLVRSARRREEIPPYLMCLEMTETSLVEADPFIWDMLARIRATGVHIGLDDFGTGFSSMTYLRDFPVSFLKIDKSFVDGIGTRRGNREIVEATVFLSHRLGMKVTAEGVEEPSQAELLRDLGCDRLQGYLFSRPVPPEVLEDMLGQQAAVSRQS
ncbi:MAG: putative bifunctional diguanylate cyclase/phosphodiesterase [Acidimicrobiia bacterium]